MVALVFPLLCLASNSILNPPFAARLPQTVTASVCGDPAISKNVLDAAEGAIRTTLRTVQGATFTFDPTPTFALGRGKSANVRIFTTVQAPGAITSYGPVTVTVKNVPLDLSSASKLWFSNQPENLTSPQVIFRQKLEMGEVIRLLYHHTNNGTHPLLIGYRLLNTGMQPAVVAVSSGDGEPGTEPVLVGMAATASYLKSYAFGNGELVQIPPGSSRMIAFRRVVMHQVSSGLCTLALLTPGADVEVVGRSLIPEAASGNLFEALLSPHPWHFMPAATVDPLDLSLPAPVTKVYLGPQQTTALEVSSGGDPKAELIGVEGIPKEGGGRHLNGNYGVVYRFNVRFFNVSNGPLKAKITMTASTNYTAGVLLMGGNIIPIGPIAKGESHLAWTQVIPPQSSLTKSFLTMPVAGGYFPAKLTFSVTS